MFFIFLKKKVSSLFFCLSFKKFSLLALVPKFICRCFLRGRCSMEMWCLTTQSGMAGIGLGHLLGREHDSTPQSGVEAPRLLKMVNLQIVLLLLFRTLYDMCVSPLHVYGMHLLIKNNANLEAWVCAAPEANQPTPHEHACASPHLQPVKNH